MNTLKKLLYILFILFGLLLIKTVNADICTGLLEKVEKYQSENKAVPAYLITACETHKCQCTEVSHTPPPSAIKPKPQQTDAQCQDVLQKIAKYVTQGNEPPAYLFSACITHGCTCDMPATSGNTACEQCKTQLNTVKKHLKSITDKREALRNEVEELNKTVNTQKEEMSKLKKALVSNNNRSSVGTSTDKDLQIKLDNLIAKRDTLQNQLNTLKEQISSEKTTREKAEKLYDQAKADIEILTQQKNTLQTQVDAIDAQCEQLNTDLVAITFERDKLARGAMSMQTIFEKLLSNRIAQFEAAVNTVCGSTISYTLDNNNQTGLQLTLNGKVVDNDVYQTELVDLKSILSEITLENALDTATQNSCTIQLNDKFNIRVKDDGTKLLTFKFNQAREVIANLPYLADCKVVGASLNARFKHELTWPIGFWALTTHGAIGTCLQRTPERPWIAKSSRPKGINLYLIQKTLETSN